MIVKRGDIFYADLGPYDGCEQGGIRPVVIIQNDIGNAHSPTVICAALSSQIKHLYLPTHVLLYHRDHRKLHDSVLLLEQVRTIDKRKLKEKIGCLSALEIDRVDRALKISLGVK